MWYDGGMRLRLIAFVVGIIIVCAILFILVRRFPVSQFYSMVAHYARMPIDDKPLENWIREQPGIVARTVHIVRKGDELRAIFIMSQSMLGSPPTPNLESTCERLGYGPFCNWQEEAASDGNSQN